MISSTRLEIPARIAHSFHDGEYVPSSSARYEPWVCDGTTMSRRLTSAPTLTSAAAIASPGTDGRARRYWRNGMTKPRTRQPIATRNDRENRPATIAWATWRSSAGPA